MPKSKSRTPNPVGAEPARGVTYDPDADLRALVEAEDNPRTCTDAARAELAKSLRRFGVVEPIVVNVRADGRRVIVAGHQRRAALLGDGVTRGPVTVVRLKLHDERALRLKLNGHAGTWDHAKLDTVLRELAAEGEAIPLAELGVDEAAHAKVLESLRDAADAAGPTGDEDAVPEPPKKPRSKRGEVYELGAHRLVCGDCTNEAHVRALLGDVQPVAILTDPPYCSGGFQEAGKRQGSIGTERTDGKGGKLRMTIANDKLSTRGYQALMRRMLELWPARVAYAFTDWRMWLSLADVMEASGYLVRSMIVWDKGTPGMGSGWRAQHELVMFGTRDVVRFDLKKSVGNVLRCGRSGNALHPTQKPVELLRAILGVTDFADVIADPFGGSGSTILAAEACGRRCYASELDEGFCDVIRTRWWQHARERGIDPGPGALPQ